MLHGPTTSHRCAVTQILIELLNEGTRVWRPAPASQVAPGMFRIGGPIPADEQWAFKPGEVVRAELHTFEDGHAALVAVALAGETL